MRTYLAVILILTCFISSSVFAQIPEEYFRYNLKLELEFGVENLPDEYMLFRPMEIEVDGRNNIYVYDENFIKIFDPNGDPKKIIRIRGREPGLNPASYRNLFISPDNYLSVSSSSREYYYYIFNPRNEFIGKRSVDREKIKNFIDGMNGTVSTRCHVRRCFPLNENEVVFWCSYNMEDETISYDRIILQTGDNLFKNIANYEEVSSIRVSFPTGGSTGTHSSAIGDTYLAILPDNTILYTHTTHDVKFHENQATLTFYLYSIKENTVETFTYTYTPEEIPEEYIIEATSRSGYPIADSSRSRMPPMQFMEQRQEQLNSKMEKALRNQKYFPLFTDMNVDNQYVFLWNNRDVVRSRVLVFDMSERKFIGISEFIITPLRIRIKNGYLYKHTIDSDFSPVIQKYRIDPKVYGK
ncbi:hypothetical protein ACFL5P_01505 [candidate division KSB1 bacterium]